MVDLTLTVSADPGLLEKVGCRPAYQSLLEPPEDLCLDMAGKVLKAGVSFTASPD